ncbi:MAG: TraB/GumN family protein [Bacteroidia bacterium]
MKSILLTLFSAIACLASWAQTGDYQGHLWKITGNGLESPSFLYGTMHVSNKVAFHLSDSFYKAIESVDVVALEINPESWMESMTSNTYIADRMGNSFSMRGDNANAGFYKALFSVDEPDNKKLGMALGQELGILNSLLYRTSNYNAEFQEDTYLDLFIYQAGRKQGKEVTGLENLGLTMRLNEEAAKPEKDPDKRKIQERAAEKKRHELLKLLKDRDFQEVMEDAYRIGDLDLLDSLSRLSSGNEKYHKLIIIYRNLKMAEAMDSIMQKKSLFAGIGAAHLPNDYGVIALLRDMGYHVQAVDRTKGDYGVQTKDRLENTFVEHQFKARTSFDGSFSTYLPGPLYEFPESDGVMMAAFPDMVNGATYVVTRILTYGQLYNRSEAELLIKIDSLLFENIPGKILSKSKIEINGYPAVDIKNKTKKGDLQRYHIVVTPVEIVILKVSGKKEFVNRMEVQQFFDKLEFHNAIVKDVKYSPVNSAYEVSFPGNAIYEGENNAFNRGYWSKNVQSFDPRDKSYFAVLNRSYSDFRFMEEDSFELSQLTRNLVKKFNYKLDSWRYDSFSHYSSFVASSHKDGAPILHLQLIAQGEQYYALLAVCNEEDKANKFFKSFRFNTFTYQRPFKHYDDSTLLFSVVTPVEEVKSNGYYYGGNDSEDDYLEVNENHTYYHKETDEMIYVQYKKFHDYAFEMHIDSIWAHRKDNLTEEGDFYIRKEKQWEKDGMYILEAEASDTNTNRNLLARYIVKGGRMYSLYAEKDKFSGSSPFIDSFFSSFTPWDTAVGVPILENKTRQFLTDLISEDSTTAEAAYKSIETISFEDDDAPYLIEAIEKTYAKDKSLEIRAQLLTYLARMDHPSVLPYLLSKYPRVEDTIRFQIPILQGIAYKRTKRTTKLFLRMLKEETPLSSESYVINSLFYVFSDSLELSKDLYPQILLLTALPEYKDHTYRYLSMLVDSGLIKKSRYKRKLNQIIWEANNEVKRQKSMEASMSIDHYDESSRYYRYYYNSSLYHYAVLLMPFEKRNGKTKKFFRRLDQIKSPGLQMDLAVLRAKNGQEVPDSLWLKFASNDNDRIELYQKLKKAGLLSLFPKQYASQMQMAISYFAEMNNLSCSKDSIQFVRKTATSLQGDSGVIYFFKSKRSYGDEYQMGYLGLFPIDSNQMIKGIPEYYHDDMSYSKFDDLNLQLDLQIRKLDMAKRRRYRVEDEERFRDLNYRRSYY